MLICVYIYVVALSGCHDDAYMAVSSAYMCAHSSVRIFVCGKIVDV